MKNRREFLGALIALAVVPFTGIVAPIPAIRSVKEFGTVGDGLTDDTAAIQAAIDASTKER